MWIAMDKEMKVICERESRKELMEALKVYSIDRLDFKIPEVHSIDITSDAGDIWCLSSINLQSFNEELETLIEEAHRDYINEASYEGNKQPMYDGR